MHLDTSGDHDFDLATDLVARRGRTVVMGGMGKHPPVPIGRIYTRAGGLAAPRDVADPAVLR